MPDDDGAVRITNREIYAAVLSLQSQVTALQSQIALVPDLATRVRALEDDKIARDTTQSHAQDVREHRRWVIPLAFTFLFVMLGLLNFLNVHA